MDLDCIRVAFGKVAKLRGYAMAFGLWYKRSDECILVLGLQRSNFGHYFELNIKIYIDGLFGRRNSIDRHTLKVGVGDVFIRPPVQYGPVLDAERYESDEQLHREICGLFEDFIGPLEDSVLNVESLLANDGLGIFTLLPAVRRQVNEIKHNEKSGE